jgi:uncharacterized FlgJ-related protein
MIYRYDKEMLEYKKVNVSLTGVKAIGAVIGLTIIMSLSTKPDYDKIDNLNDTEIQIVLSKHNEFSQTKLIERIKELNFKFPYIVLAQSKLETGNYTSKMFNENNNLFGMKQATVRLNMAGGTQHGHAYYDSWTESLYDYALYSATYLHKIKTEREYFDYLSQFYAEDTLYVKRLQQIITKENLKSKF